MSDPAPQTIDLRITRDLPKAGPLFRKGRELRATRQELKDRKVPDDAFEVIACCSGLPPASNPETPAPAPGSVGSSATSTAKK